MPAKKIEEEEIQANLLPVMNIMFLLIPALLLAMEFASMAAISVAPPRFTHNPADAPPRDPPLVKPLNFKVFVMEDGFRVSADGLQQEAAADTATDSRAPTIALARPGAPLSDYDRYDYAALEELGRRYKNLAPDESVVTLSAESKIPLQTMINAMDALAGRGCKIGGALQGEAVPDECHFWRPVMESGAG